MKRNELEKFLQKKKDAMPSITLNFEHFASQYLSFATKMRRKLRQHTGRSCPHTGRHPVKSPKHTQNEKDIFQKGARKKG